MMGQTEYRWAIPTNMEPDVIIANAKLAAEAIDRLKRPVSDEDIQNILEYYGFNLGTWTVRLDLCSLDYTLYNPVYSCMKRG